jgi:hypothetical protein
MLARFLTAIRNLIRDTRTEMRRPLAEEEELRAWGDRNSW